MIYFDNNYHGNMDHILILITYNDNDLLFYDLILFFHIFLFLLFYKITLCLYINHFLL